VRARHDPVWTADGYVSDRWRPVSPVTGRLDAFQWQTPVASLPSDKAATIEASPFEEAMLAAPTPRREQLGHDAVPVEPPSEPVPEIAPQPATQDNSPPAPEPEAKIEPKIDSKIEPKTIEPAAPAEPVPALAPAPVLSAPEPSPAAAPQPESPPPAAPAPLFRARSDLGRPAPGRPPIAPVPAVIPILRAPDDPGIDDEAPVDEFTEKIGTPRAQAGGWRGFWSRWGG
jgi:HemY protein